jgi:8-oxo-dGTP diphosphatase
MRNTGLNALSKNIHVAVGILVNEQSQILIAKRPDNLHQGGLWEFPGGKVENGEKVFEALVREFAEEVNIKIISAEPFMEIHHDYGDKQVFLDVWLSKDFSGIAQGLEGQEIKWAALEGFSELNFPKANEAIIQKLIKEKSVVN